MPKLVVSLRVNVPLPLFERLGEYRYTARHNSKNQALVTLLAAGLASLAKSVELPKDALPSSVSATPPRPRARSSRPKLIMAAGDVPPGRRPNGEARTDA